MLVDNKDYITYEKSKLDNYCDNLEYYYKIMMIYNLALYIGFVGLLFERIGFFNNIDDIVYNFIWNCLKIYSYCCLYVNKYINSKLKIVFNNKYKQIKLFLNGPSDNFIIIRDGDEIISFKYMHHLIEYYLVNKNIKNLDLIYMNDKLLYYTTCFEFLKMIKNQETLFNYDIASTFEFSSIKFISCDIFIIYKNKDLFIKKSIDINNFMIVNSKLLSKSFVFWYCNKYFNLDKHFIEHYNIEIIDHDVYSLSINMNDFIEIHKDKYVVHKIKNHPEETINEDADDDAEDAEDAEDDDTQENEMDKIISYEETDNIITDNNEPLTYNNENEENDYDSYENDYDTYENECKYHKDLEDANEIFNESIEEYKNSSWVSRLLF